MRRLVLLLLAIVSGISMLAADSFSYIYKRDGLTHIRNGGSDIESMVARSKRWPGEYVWLQRNGRQYLIRDAAVLAEVRNAFAELHAYEPRLRAAEERLRPVERKMETVERRMDRIGDRLSDDEDLDSATRADLERQLRQVELELKELERSYIPAERETERMEREHDRLEKIAEARFEKIVFRAVDAGKAERVN
jgi:hypothetical protein